MIDQVKQGEKITAEGQNKIIDAVNELTIGNFNSSDGFNFGRQKSRDGFPCLFQCKVGRGFTMTSREDNSYSNNTTTTTWLFLGKDKTTLFANVGLQIQKDHFLVMSPVSAAKGDLQDSWFKRNGSSSYYDGWIDSLCTYQDYSAPFNTFSINLFSTTSVTSILFVNTFSSTNKSAALC